MNNCDLLKNFSQRTVEETEKSAESYQFFHLLKGGDIFYHQKGGDGCFRYHISKAYLGKGTAVRKGIVQKCLGIWQFKGISTIKLH